MPVWLTITIAVLPALITGFVAFYLAKKSQINKNTDELLKLSRQLGLSDEQTLASKISIIYNDIGRDDGASLTKQHSQICDNIEHSFSVIKERYEKEDSIYRLFKQKQYDLKETLDNFSRDYAEMAKRLNDVTDENCTLRMQNENLTNQLNALSQAEEKREPNRNRNNFFGR